MKNKHLEMLTEINWNRMEYFISMPDGSGNWIFGDGVYALRMPGAPLVKEGNDEILPHMINFLDYAVCEHNKKPIMLPSVGYLKKKNKAMKFEYRIPIKMPDVEIFVNSMLLYHMLKILPGAEAYSVDMEGYHLYKSGKAKARAVYLVSEKGEGVLMPVILPGRLCHENA